MHKVNFAALGQAGFPLALPPVAGTAVSHYNTSHHVTIDDA